MIRWLDDHLYAVIWPTLCLAAALLYAHMTGAL